MTASNQWFERLQSEGVDLWRGVFSAKESQQIGQELDECLARSGGMKSRGVVFAARNLLDVYPPSQTLWQRPPLTERLAAVLGPDFGLVRGLYFDKPPERTWSLPWHKDMTIAVRCHRPSQKLCKPTVKEGVPHVEASADILKSMLTLRIHLDDVTTENGPLEVIPGSHHSGKADLDEYPPSRMILAEAGDVLAIRPLVAHCSGSSKEGTARRRRIVHLEFAAKKHLPDGFEWRWFIHA